MTHDVLITGIGAICAIGRSPVEIFASAMTGCSGVRAAPHLAFGAAVPLVARAPFDAASVAMRTRSAPLDRVSALALEAARQALADAGASPAPSTDARLGVYWGTGAGGVESQEEGYRLIFGLDNFRVRPTTVVTVMSNAPAACVSIDAQAGGPCLTYSVACASSAIAIGEAMLAIRSGRIDRAIAGGSEAMLTRPVLAAWSALRALASADAVDPSTSCKPFAADRCGFVLGEGAAAVLLESADHATARGARGYAQLAGYGVASDAAHLADPSSEGQSRAMALALDDAALDPGDVGYINAHGTATSAGDRAETRSIKRVFGEHARSTAVSSTKAVHGHAMGAAGALEFVIALMALHHRAVPPTAHLRRPDPELDLDFVAHGGRHDVDLEAVMSNSFAFGGTNAVLAARRCPPALSRA
jgi:3-oxoacyl-[acyl-carrier-protein] synthase II